MTRTKPTRITEVTLRWHFNPGPELWYSDSALAGSYLIPDSVSATISKRDGGELGADVTVFGKLRLADGTMTSKYVHRSWYLHKVAFPDNWAERPRWIGELVDSEITTALVLLSNIGDTPPQTKEIERKR